MLSTNNLMLENIRLFLYIFDCVFYISYLSLFRIYNYCNLTHYVVLCRHSRSTEVLYTWFSSITRFPSSTSISRLILCLVRNNIDCYIFDLMKQNRDSHKTQHFEQCLRRIFRFILCQSDYCVIPFKETEVGNV